MKFTYLLAIFAVIVCACMVSADDEGGNSPSYVMPAAMPTPYYSQFLPPYQNFNPFYPLPSVSYVGPSRSPFRQFSPYYYYGGPIQWGAGPASAVPNPTAAVVGAPAAFMEVEAEVDVDAEAEAEAEAETEADAEEEMPSFVETDAARVDLNNYQTATYHYKNQVDPIVQLREQARAMNFARGAMWADKFDSYNSKYENNQRNKAIKDMRESGSRLSDPSFAHASFVEMEEY